VSVVRSLDQPTVIYVRSSYRLNSYELW